MAIIDKLEQGRAEFAYQCAEEGEKLERQKEYKQYVRKIPMLIKTNGLGATLAFILSKQSSDKSKSGYAYKIIYAQIGNWLKKAPTISWSIPENEPIEQTIISLDSAQYRLVTKEVIAFFNWLRRFAEGLID